MRDLIRRAVEAFERGRRFVTHDVWRLGAPGEEAPHGLIIKHVRVAILLVQNLVRDALTLRAAALTFATALGIIPFLAILFFGIQTFHVDEEIYAYLSAQLEQMKTSSAVTTMERTAKPTGEPTGPEDEAADDVDIQAGPGAPATEADGEDGSVPAESGAPERDLKQDFIDLMFQGVGQLDKTEDGKPLQNPVKAIVAYAQEGANAQTIGLAGLVFVLTAVFGLMKNIESSFNTIWGLKRRRSWYRMFSNYLTLLVLLPFVVALVISLTAILESDQIRDRLGPFAFGLRSVQYVVIWFVFTAMYLFVPHTRVRLRYAVVGGVVAGTLWCLLSWAYVKFQVGVPKYSIFFSTFAQVPVLLMWVYFSWLILLFGAELAFAYQYETTFAMERLAEGASYAYREALGLWAMVALARRFDAGQPPLSIVEIAEHGRAPTRLVTAAFETLATAGIVTQSDAEATTYQPARPLAKITVGDIMTALREAGRDPSDLRSEPSLRPFLAELFDGYSGRAAETLEDLIGRLPATDGPRAALGEGT